MKKAWMIVGAIFAVLLVGSILYANNVSDKYDEGVDLTKTYSKGNADSEVVLVEYSDFQCPACASWHPIVKDIMSNFGDDIRFEYRHFPLPIHNLAKPAARAVEAAGQQGKFFEYHDLVFENQTEWVNSPNPDAMFIKYAKELDLDIDKFSRHMKSTLLDKKIEADMKEGLNKNVNATPTFFLNGEKIVFGPEMSSDDSVEFIYNSVAKAVATKEGVESELSTSTESSPE